MQSVVERRFGQFKWREWQRREQCLPGRKLAVSDLGTFRAGAKAENMPDFNVELTRIAD